MATNEARATVRESAERWRARVVGDVVPWVVVRVVFTRSRPVTRSPAYPARLSRLLRLTSIASTEYSRPLASIGVVGVMQREAVAHGKDARKL